MYIAKMNDSYTGLAKPAEEMVLGEDFCISSDPFQRSAGNV